MPDLASRLFLITPVLAEAAPFEAPLRAALAAADVACLLVRHGARDERAAKALVRAVAAVAQPLGTAVLVAADPRLAAHADADGVHVGGVGDALADAIERLKPERIVGCGGLLMRDDAMTAGERDVDYLMFGEPGPHGDLPDPSFTLDRVQWWAEIFNLPCVGYAQTLDAVGPLAAAGADFVALGDAVWGDPRGQASAMADAWASVRAEAAKAAALADARR